jgi:NTP pyrophosphatase (non-canonical NTP hydrolase)
MDLKEYQKLCKSTANTYEDKEKEIFTWGLGLIGEAGDAIGCIKKTYSQGEDQVQGIRENLGDIMWYIAMICNYYDWDMNDVLKENVDKLKKRYPNGFTEENARRGGTRVDWMEK